MRKNVKKERIKLALLVIIAFVMGFAIGGQFGPSVSEQPSQKLIMTILYSNDCETCDTSRIKQVTEQLFPGVVINELDYKSVQGEKLYNELGVTLLPVYVFSSNIQDHQNYARIQGALVKKGEFFVIDPRAAGSFYDPTKESECSDGKDDDGDGIVDCDDDDCSASMECRPEIPNRVDLFVMSMCPFGIRAENSWKEVSEALKGVELNIHFIANDNGDGTFTSLHGQPEVDEDIRQVCAMKYYPDKYMDYIWCRNKNIQNTDWQSCTDEAGIDANKIQSCFDAEEGKELLRENIALTNELGISASPTWLANNRFKFSGIDAETIKSNICQHNPGLSGCGQTLSSDTTVSGSC